MLSKVHAMAHITGGGFPGILNRALPPTLDAVVDTAAGRFPICFSSSQQAGGVGRDEMFRAFNMGVGMVVIADPGSAKTSIRRGARRENFGLGDRSNASEAPEGHS